VEMVVEEGPTRSSILHLSSSLDLVSNSGSNRNFNPSPNRLGTRTISNSSSHLLSSSTNMITAASTAESDLLFVKERGRELKESKDRERDLKVLKEKERKAAEEKEREEQQRALLLREKKLKERQVLKLQELKQRNFSYF